MSKRSYRRLAAVTGAALAIGAMAPALAAQVGASVSADPSLQVTDVTGLVPSTSGLLPPTGLVSTAQSTVAAAPGMVLADAGDLSDALFGIGTGLLAGPDTTIGHAGGSVDVLDNSVVVDQTVGAPLGGLAGIVADPLGTAGPALGAVTGAAAPVVPLAQGAAAPFVTYAGGLPGTVLGAGGGLLSGGLGLLSNAPGNANVVASVMASL